MERSTWLSAAKWTMAEGRCSREEAGDETRVADVAVDEGVAGIAGERGEVGGVAGVGELVEIDDRGDAIGVLVID